MDTPTQHHYLRSIYSMTIDGAAVAFTFCAGRFSLTTPLPIPAESWAIVTAWNPMSVALDEATNRQRDDALEQALGALGLLSHPSANSAVDGAWHEPGRLVLNCTRPQALGLANRFQQRAIIWSQAGKVGILDRRTDAWTIRPVKLANALSRS